jgi:hypothetical protein
MESNTEMPNKESIKGLDNGLIERKRKQNRKPPLGKESLQWFQIILLET